MTSPLRTARAALLLLIPMMLFIACNAAAAPLPGAGSLHSSSSAPPPGPVTPDPDPDPGPDPGPGAGDPTVVSLTFDDGNADQTQAVPVLARHGLPATFFIISGQIGQPGYMTRTDLDGLQAAGHEIGGHTVTHPDLTTVGAAEAEREICNDRRTLTDWGFRVTSLAYPFASNDPALAQIAGRCGYNSARDLGGVGDCEWCVPAESIPPADTYATRAPEQVNASWTLQDLQRTVTRAEDGGGGWVQLTFHHVCNPGEQACHPETSIAPALFEEFVAWLAQRPATTSVRTVDQVIGGPVAPVVSGPHAPPAAPGTNALVNPGLEDIGQDGLPVCWSIAGFGENSAQFETVSPGRTGAIAGKLTVTRYTDGDAKLIATPDLGECSATAVPGEKYELEAWYKSTEQTQFAVYLRNDVGTWQYWTSSPFFGAADEYTRAHWTTGPLPEWATAISFGLNLMGVGTLTTDDYSLTRLGGA